jgi:hypothetical protein
MLNKKKAIAIVVAVILVLGVIVITFASGDTSAVMEDEMISFEMHDETDVSGVGMAYEVEQPYYIETRSAVVKNLKDGSEYELDGGVMENGTISYQFSVKKGTLKEDEMEVISPVLYIEEECGDAVSLSALEENEYLNLTISDSMEEFPDADQGVLVEYTAKNIDCVPYELVLQSGGETYDNYAVSYYFDLETGDFTHGYYLYYGITVDELSQDATLETNFVINRYEPTSYELN